MLVEVHAEHVRATELACLGISLIQDGDAAGYSRSPAFAVGLAAATTRLARQQSLQGFSTKPVAASLERLHRIVSMAVGIGGDTGDVGLLSRSASSKERRIQ